MGYAHKFFLPKKIQNLTIEADKLKEELRGMFLEVFPGRLGWCQKSAKFELKPNTQSVFKKKRNVPFASLNQINNNIN